MRLLNIAILTAVLSATHVGVAAEDLTRVELDASKTGETISPRLFGHNLEVTRRGIWRGLGAEMVANRKFAATEKGMPKRWTIIGASDQVSIDEHVAYAGKQSVRVEMLHEGSPGGIVQAQESLAFQKGDTYAVRLWLRTAADRTVKLRISDALGKQVFFENSATAKTGDWQLVSAKFVAPTTADNNRLEISSPTPGVFWIGAVSGQPANAFHGMRRDVIELLKRIQPGSLRFPGGCYAEFYRWQEGLLPADERPPIGPTGLSFLLPENDDYDSHEIGIDEFMALSREVGSEPAITMRLSENTPEDAAAWVEYCNGAPETQWGKIRAQRGHPKPYQVKCWFVGNELYAFGRGGLNQAEDAARQTRLFASAMKKADPGIHLVGCTRSGGGDWNKMLIGEAGDLLDLFSTHDYLLDHFKGDLPVIASAPTRILRPLLQNVWTTLQRELPSGRRLGVAFDEWNTRWGLPGSVGMGLYAAGVLNLLCREATSLQIERAYFFMPVNEGAIRVTPLGANLDAAGEVFELFKVHQGNRRLNTPAMSPDADLDLCASVTTDEGQVYVTVVNRSISTERTVEFELRNFSGLTKAAVKFLIPLALDSRTPEFGQLNGMPRVLDDNRVRVAIPPCAIARVRFGRP